MKAGVLVAAPCFAFGVAVAFGATFVGGSVSAVEAPRPVRDVYLSDCAVCHGADGRGTPEGPSLLKVGAAAIDYWVSTGRMPLPPGHHGIRIDRRPPKYPRSEIDALVRYVAALTGGGPPIPRVSTVGANVAEGGVQYRLNCAACHSWAGNGGALANREAPALYASTPTQIAEAVRTGPDPMPAFGTAAITDTQLNDLVAYIETLDHPDDRGGNPLWHAGPLAEGAAGIVLGLGAIILATRLIGTRT
ncbi:MAG: cytochrome c class [Actinomycetia bacterium]|nr:cytochrome c class [Actinomycetes bacterium]